MAGGEAVDPWDNVSSTVLGDSNISSILLQDWSCMWSSREEVDELGCTGEAEGAREADVCVSDERRGW